MKGLIYKHFEDTTEELEYTIKASLNGVFVCFEVIVEDVFSITFLLEDFKRILQMMENVIDSEIVDIDLDVDKPYDCKINSQDNSYHFYVCVYDMNNRIEEITGFFAFTLGNYCAKQTEQYEKEKEGGE